MKCSGTYVLCFRLFYFTCKGARAQLFNLLHYFIICKKRFVNIDLLILLFIYFYKMAIVRGYVRIYLLLLNIYLFVCQPLRNLKHYDHFVAYRVAVLTSYPGFCPKVIVGSKCQSIPVSLSGNNGLCSSESTLRSVSGQSNIVGKWGIASADAGDIKSAIIVGLITRRLLY